MNNIAGIHGICAEQDDDSFTAGVSTMLPPFLAREIADMYHAKFCTIVRTQIECLQTTFTRRNIAVLEQKHQAFREVVSSEQPLKDALEASDSQTSLFNSWRILNSRFQELESFWGGLLSVFPGTRQVESYISIFKFKKDDFRSQLTDLSLKVILNAKEFEKAVVRSNR